MFWCQAFKENIKMMLGMQVESEERKTGLKAIMGQVVYNARNREYGGLTEIREGTWMKKLVTKQHNIEDN